MDVERTKIGYQCSQCIIRSMDVRIASRIVCIRWQLGFSKFFFQAEDGIRDLVRSRGLGDVYKRQSAYSRRRSMTVCPRNGLRSTRRVSHAMFVVLQ